MHLFIVLQNWPSELTILKMIFAKMELWSLAAVRIEIPWSLLQDFWRVLSFAPDTSCRGPCWLRWGPRPSCAVGAETSASLFHMLTLCSSPLATPADVWAWGRTKHVEVGVGKIQLQDTMLWGRGVLDGLGFIGGGREQGRQPRWREGGGGTGLNSPPTLPWRGAEPVG